MIKVAMKGIKAKHALSSFCGGGFRPGEFSALECGATPTRPPPKMQKTTLKMGAETMEEPIGSIFGARDRTRMRYKYVSTY
jgi:hypothetical protein